MTGKKTKIEFFSELKELIKSLDILDSNTANEYINFIDRELTALEKRRLNAKARNARLRAESDELTKVIYEMLTDEPMTINDIMEELNSEAVTAGKIASRMTRLSKEGIVEKETIRSHGRKKVAYKRAPENSDAEVDTEIE